MNGIIVNIEREELENLIRKTISDELDDRFLVLEDRLAASAQTPAKNRGDGAEYLTRKQVSEILHLSLPRLHRYENAGILRPSRVGRRVLYRRTDIEQVMKGGYPALKRGKS